MMSLLVFGAAPPPLIAASRASSRPTRSSCAPSASLAPTPHATRAAPCPLASAAPDRRGLLLGTAAGLAAALASAALPPVVHAKVTTAEALEKYRAEAKVVVAGIRGVVEASVPGVDLAELKAQGKPVKAKTENFVITYGLRCATTPECTKMSMANKYVDAEPSYVRFTDVLKELGRYREENGEELPTEAQRASLLKGLDEVVSLL